MTEAISQAARQLHAYYVPWRESCNLLLPATVVAEILYHLEIIPLEHDSPWVQGGVEWRGLTVPLVSFNEVDDIPAEAKGETRRVLICRTLSFNDRYAYVAIDFYRLPRMLFVDESSLVVLEEGMGSSEWPFVATVVDIRGNTIYVLDMEKLSNLI
ncbi:MAG: chemotaxis protein CheW [Pseudomonadales bacterium]|nr:chemotaxis protein CheW [Pseudomonadales bacterium]